MAPLGHHRLPTKLLGTIGSMEVRVLLRQQGTQATGRYTACSVGFPQGPWDDRSITVRSASRAPRIWRRRGVATGDPDFDRQFAIRLGPSEFDPTAAEWVTAFLTDERRRALLDLRSRRPGVRLVTGRQVTDDRQSGLVDALGGRARNRTIIESVRAMLACAGVLVADA